MHTDQIRAAAHKACSAGVVIAGLQFALIGLPAVAQTTSPATAADNAPSEAARRAAASPYRFILQNASAPARKPAPPAPAPAEAKRPAPEQTASSRPAAPAPVQAAPVQAPVAAPEPQSVAVRAPKPAEPEPIAAVKREIIPIKTDDPRLPAALLREKPSGVVRVSFDLNPDGSTSGAKVVSSTNRALNRASVEAVSGWKFQPVDEVLTIETELAYNYQ